MDTAMNRSTPGGRSPQRGGMRMEKQDMTDAPGVVPHTAPMVRPPSLVIVDDEPGILHSLQSLFRKDPWNVRTFSSPRAALDGLANMPAEIVISDLRMPEMNGIEFLNHVSHRSPEAARFILTGHEDHAVVISALGKNLAQHYVLKPWEDAGLRKILQDTLRTQSETKSRLMLELLDAFERLPNLASHNRKLQELLSKTKYSLNDIVIEIQKSPALVARLLRVANSIYYATRRPVMTVRDAVQFIGTDYIASLIVAMESFHAVMSTSDGAPEHLIEGLWNRSLQRAIIARQLASAGPWVADAQLAYVVALLQDLGLVARLCSDPVRFARVMELEQAGEISLYDAECAVFGPPHDTLGASLLESWNLPKEIVRPIAEHHSTSTANPIVHVVQLADLLATPGKPSPHDPSIEAYLQESWRVVNN
jgi:HD-like signal output (HDOD) protein